MRELFILRKRKKKKCKRIKHMVSGKCNDMFVILFVETTMASVRG